MTRDELERYRNDPNGVFYKITHSKSDHTELKKISEEVRVAMKIEHEKERRLILEARERGEI